jgi:hypothetical protein
MTCSVLRPGAFASALPSRSFGRSTGFGQVRHARSSRAKTNYVKDAGSVNGSAIRGTKNAVRTASGSTDRTQPVAQDDAHIKSPCTRVQFNANQCPAGSLLGFAGAKTPLLEKPLEGPVYLRANGGERKLPDLVAQLKGQIDINLVAFVEELHTGQLRTTFETVPDAPVSRFTLDLDGGNKGLLVNSINLCFAAEHVNVQIDGQNGKTANQIPVLQTPCGKKHKGKTRVHHSRRAHR